jgi:hypothetical protein
MTDLTVAAETCVALGATDHQFESYPGRDIALGALTVTRVLPVKGRRLVGPWCFLDRFGPLTFTDPLPMDVGAHPHMGLQTVTWLLDGEIVHYDSLGYESLLRPGGVNVMTSGGAIAHAERTPATNSGRLNGVQLWVALPDATATARRCFNMSSVCPSASHGAGSFKCSRGASAPWRHRPRTTPGLLAAMCRSIREQPSTSHWNVHTSTPCWS